MDADFQDFRISFRIRVKPCQFCLTHAGGQMRSRTKFDLPGSREKLGEASMKCSIQMCYSLALITKGSVQTLDLSVEESNRAEAWRLMHSRFAPDTQNRQHALMQEIMMPVKSWCDHTEGFESGLRAWELDVGEWERASGPSLADAVKYTSDGENGTDLSQEHPCMCVFMQTVQLFEPIGCIGVSIPSIFGKHPRQLQQGIKTGADDDKMLQVNLLKKVKEQGQDTHPNPKGTRTSIIDVNTCKNCGRTGH